MSCYRDQDLTTVKLLVHFYRKIDFQSQSDLILSDKNFDVSKDTLKEKSQNSINYIKILKIGY